MLTASDLLRIPYTPDLTEGGITYACRALPHTYNRVGGSPFDRLRRIVAGVAVELAFRRSLTQQNIPFDIQGATPFTDTHWWWIFRVAQSADKAVELLRKAGAKMMEKMGEKKEEMKEKEKDAEKEKKE